jgi:hypothetical protein
MRHRPFVRRIFYHRFFEILEKKLPNKKYGFCVGFARFRISAPVRRQIKAGIQKKSTVPPVLLPFIGKSFLEC